MNSSASLPLPVGARIAVPTSRSVAQAWAAPRAADLVLDPWAAPVGPPIAQYLLSPWSAPDPSLRIISMPPPIALVKVPDLSDMSERTHGLAASTDAAISALNSAAARSAVIGANAAPAAPAAPITTGADDQVWADDGGPDIWAAPVETPKRSIARLRAKMWAMIAGGAAATVGVVTLISAAL